MGKRLIPPESRVAAMKPKGVVPDWHGSRVAKYLTSTKKTLKDFESESMFLNDENAFLASDSIPDLSFVEKEKKSKKEKERKKADRSKDMDSFMFLDLDEDKFMELS